MSDGYATGRKLLKTCDVCKSRKVKCSGYPGPCKDCVRRKVKCRFSRMKIPRRLNTNAEFFNLNPSPSTMATMVSKRTLQEQPTLNKAIPELYLDRLLALARSPDIPNIDDSLFSVNRNALFAGYSLTFFSESRLNLLSTRLRNDKVKELVQRISLVVLSRLNRQENLSSSSLPQGRAHFEDILIDADKAKDCIKLYFDHVHPFYPILDRKAFESVAFGTQLTRVLMQNKAWSALYHSVLALGCQVSGGSSFEPGKGLSWELFAKSLALFPDLMTMPDSLTVLQALAAMTIYSLGISCLAIEHVIISEAARRAQNLCGANLTESAAFSHRKILWVLYSVEKITSFHFGRNSVFVDHNLVIPIPSIPDSVFGDFDWFLTCVTYARLLSRAMTSLFCAGVLGNSKAYYVAAIDQLNDELENWRLSIPQDCRPCEDHYGPVVDGTFRRSAALWTHFLYNSFRLSLCRAMLHLAAQSKDIVSPEQQAESTRMMMATSRSTLQLTTYIDVQPYTPLWILGGIPLTSHFVLFDLVVNNPKYEETRSNLALLDIAGGHFSRIEYASGGCLPGSLIAEFVHIAREYVHDVNRNESQPLGNEAPSFPPPHDANTLELQQPRPTVPSSGGGILFAEIPAQAQPLISEVLPDQCPSSEALPAMGSRLYFSVDGNFPPYGNGLMGTDVMDLFNTFIPGIDPIFFNQINEDTSFGMADM